MLHAPVWLTIAIAAIPLIVLLAVLFTSDLDHPRNDEEPGDGGQDDDDGRDARLAA